MVTGVYVRVSTEEQAKEGYSIRAQEEKLRAYAMLKEWGIYSVYADEGISGKDIEGRPAVKQLIADIVSGKVQNVLVYKIDRLTRSTKNLIELVELFNENNCAFNSVVESIDTASATGRMFLKIVGIFAEFERENLAERVRLAFERKVKEGYSLATYRQSYGYNREKGNNIQLVDNGESIVVQRIFDMYLNGDLNLCQIARTLNAENIPSKMGKRWMSTTIKQILKNPTYTGKVRYSLQDASRYFEADGHHQPIIDDDIYDQVQDKMGKISRIAYTKRPSSGVYFCGLLHCPKCGGKYGAKWSYIERNGTDKNRRKGYPTYLCNNASQERGCMEPKSMSHAKLDVAFIDYIERYDDLSMSGAEQTDPTPDHNTEMAVISTELGQIENKIKEAMELFMSGSFDYEDYHGMVKVGRERRGELETRLAQLEKIKQSQRVRFSKAEIVSNIRENWKELDNEQRQQFVQKFIKKIIAHGEKPRTGRINDVVIDEIVFNEF
jgi:site-specific DNA recombinase